MKNYSNVTMAKSVTYCLKLDPFFLVCSLLDTYSLEQLCLSERLLAAFGTHHGFVICKIVTMLRFFFNKERYEQFQLYGCDICGLNLK